MMESEWLEAAKELHSERLPRLSGYDPSVHTTPPSAAPNYM